MWMQKYPILQYKFAISPKTFAQKSIFDGINTKMRGFYNMLIISKLHPYKGLKSTPVHIFTERVHISGERGLQRSNRL